jgi:hypothetical protein
VCFVLSGALCIACGGAKGVDLFDPPGMLPSAAGAAELAAAGASAAGASAAGASGSSVAGAAAATSGGATTVTIEPSLPAAGAPAAGAGGALLGDSGAPVAMRSLVDDMEAYVSSIPESDGRAGYWYTFNDGQGGTQQPAPNGPFLPDLVSGGFPGSTRARHTQGAGFSSYAGFGVDLNNRAGQREAYDASAYKGIVLWLRGSGQVRAMFPTRATAPTTEGGDCTSSCNDSFGLNLTASEDWSEQTVPFSALQQLNTASALAFDPKALLGIAFSLQVGGNFDVWVDEIGFY